MADKKIRDYGYFYTEAKYMYIAISRIVQLL